ncbi:hypothetical protein K437DRAFT_265757 [Tilletiaria anomala UBC 951]|uniref:NADH dehydrogenase [ubiquinone] iron-sulfur protein 5 n=1 Tax=Tilletiaria anomala (strain ATCC 24038 / CBS 436.72 / UBC 951) TaxID=1037660 RepID=A0A066WQX5_TILAU|nr:uncharacterized protein K437DRAFT_265757 [Tilletiaria anomala UBC 951]KDN53389.1 hypothetical protein K437DRAFT_265757 [Tilletiaria anomala UBC 951]
MAVSWFSSRAYGKPVWDPGSREERVESDILRGHGNPASSQRCSEVSETAAMISSLAAHLSGFGFNGGRSRCFTFWQEFQKCYANADSPSDCVAQKDDYMECLHHGKEIARGKQLQEHYLARQAKEAKEARTEGELRATGGILSLGIIGRENDMKAQEKGQQDQRNGNAQAGN